MNGYVCFHPTKGRTEVYANTSYEAQQLAAAKLKIKPAKAYEVTVILSQRDSEQVTHNPSILPNS